VTLNLLLRLVPRVRWSAVSWVFVMQSMGTLLRSTSLVESILERKIDCISSSPTRFLYSNTRSKQIICISKPLARHNKVTSLPLTVVLESVSKSWMFQLLPIVLVWIDITHGIACFCACGTLIFMCVCAWFFVYGLCLCLWGQRKRKSDEVADRHRSVDIM
jgi:hypothetical protein